MSPPVNRRYVLRNRPAGMFAPSDLELVREPAPTPGPGQALVRTMLLSLDPSNRIWMGEGESYMPPVALGEAMRGLGIGRVVASRASAYPVGSLVLGMLGWQDYALIAADDPLPARRLPRIPGIEPASMLGALGVTGLTAFFGVRDVGRPRRGETFVVSAAAGAVGSVAGQLAKLAGARVVGIASSQEKRRWLLEELGFDAVVCRRDQDWRERLRQACPSGVDVDFENAGGEIMEAVFDLLNLNARVVLCGLISEYAEDGGASGPRNFSNLLMRRVRVQGFNVGDYTRRFDIALAQLALLKLTGRLKERNTMVHGLEAAPEALLGMFAGENIGKLVVEVSP